MKHGDALLAAAARLLGECRARGLTIATAESCTGGAIVALLTEIPGASAVVERGFVTYSNAAKAEMLGVDPELIERHGAVSSEVARAMAEGALRHSRADITVAVTGIAGPAGGTPAKPVGLVHIAVTRRGQAARAHEYRFADEGRANIRLASIGEALKLLLGVIGD